jgi:hypothetical protein
VKGQLLVTSLSLLLEQRTPQNRLRRQSPPSRLAHPLTAQIARNQARPAGAAHPAIQPLQDRFQLAADLVLRKNLEYMAWTVRSCRIVGFGGAG